MLEQLLRATDAGTGGAIGDTIIDSKWLLTVIKLARAAAAS